MFSLSLIIILNGFIQNRLLHKAIENNNYKAANKAINRGAWINTPKHIFDFVVFSYNRTPLMTACENGNEEIVKLLIESGADVNKTDTVINVHPINSALDGTNQNRYKIVLYLISKGADANLTRFGSSDVLQDSISIYDTDTEETIAEGYELFLYLLDNNASTSFSLKNNAFTWAAYMNNSTVIIHLIENNYYAVNDYDENMSTALTVAAKCNKSAIIKLLLNYGANATLKDAYDKTALDYAIENGNEEIIELLKEG